MKTFVVTGYSGKMDGFLTIIRADTLIDALHKHRDQDQEVCELPDGQLFLVSRGMSMADVQADVDNGESPRWYWQIFGQEYEEGINLKDAVCW